MPITARQKRQLDEALRDAFRRRAALARMLSYQCGRNLDDYAGTGGLKEVVFELVERADAENWIDRLVRGAMTENPGNPQLRALFDSTWFTVDPDLPSRASLETMIEPALGFIDVDGWLMAAQEMTRRVCRVELTDGMPLGTGFLVGPACLLTNYHVVSDFVDLRDRRPPLAFRFDFRVLPDGSEKQGTVVLPAADWLLAFTPFSDWDSDLIRSELPTRDELDFALISLADSRGDTVGWVDIKSAAEIPNSGQPLIILQHPQALPLKLAIDTKAVIALNANGTRLEYRTNTLPGSSGSPCFDIAWRPVALHHSGDRAAPRFAPKRNAGIPLQAIHEYLAEHGRDRFLGEHIHRA